MYLISVTTFIWSVKKGGSQIFFINTMLRYRISFYILYFNKIFFFLPTNIPRILLNKDLLIFVPGPGLQLLLVFIVKSAKNVIKNYFFLQKKFYFTIYYIFLQNISKLQEKSFINNYLITNYWFWALHDYNFY